MPQKLIPTALKFEDFKDDAVISDFLNAQKKGTKATYSSVMRIIRGFTPESGAEILANGKQWLRKIFVLQQWLIEEGYSETYAQSATGLIRGFFGYYRQPLIFTRTECKRLAERSRSTEDYRFEKSDIEKMAIAGNLKERYVLLVGKSLGLRAGDFVNITYGRYRNLKLDSEAPIFIGSIITQKEKVPAYPFLDSDAIPIVKQILESNKDKPDSEYILMTKSKKLHNTFQKMRDEELSIILQSLAKKAGMKLDVNKKGKEVGSVHGQRIRFHCMRKYLCDRLSSLMSESKWKQIIGKKIGEGAYISPDSLKEDFNRAMPSIAISNGNVDIKKLEQTQQSIETMAQIISKQKAEIERLISQMASKSDTDAMQKMMFDLAQKVKVLEETEQQKPVKVDFT